MEHIVEFFLKKIKLLLKISFIVVIVCCIYCYSISGEIIIEYILKSISMYVFFLSPLLMAKLNNFTGATEFFTRTKGVREMYIYGFFNMVFFIMIIVIFSIILVFRDRDFICSVMLMPSMFGGYTTAKSVRMYEKKLIEIENNKIEF